MVEATKLAGTLIPRQAAKGSHRNHDSNSVSSVIWTLVPVFLFACLAFVAFLLLRRTISRVYHPRSLGSIVPQHDRTPQAKSSLFGWMSDFKALPDTHVLQHQSLDGYLYLRFLKMMVIICFAGCCITWPILFPVNATGGGGQSQLDILSFSNVANAKRYWAHTIVSWIYHGFVLYMVTRERVFFIGLRQAYFLSSFHAQRLSSRVVLFLGVPEDNVHESQLRKIFGPNVNRVWMLPDSEALEDLVERRNQAWDKLEKAQVKLTKEANTRRLKEPDLESVTDYPQQWMVSKDRPVHRLKPLIGKKVDTINHSRTELTSTAPEIKRLQENVFNEGEKLKTAAFIEFSNQLAAERAFQFAANEDSTSMHPRYIGVLPNEVIWKNLGAGYKSRRTKLILATVIVWLLVIFWAFPVALVGVLTNINYLTEKVPFLSFIDKVPPKILGIITGLLPTLLILILMKLVPIFCKALAKFAGLPTLSTVELQVQTWYFVFQLIQVFLVTTFTSGAAAVVSQIIAEPKLAVTLLAQNLPKASNFYISYFIYYGLLLAMLQLLNLVPLITIMGLGNLLDKTPRKLYNRWMNLKGLSWGKIYPKFTLLGVIALSYSCTAPLVLGFATIGFSLLYLGFRYNFLFAYGVKVDTKGESYSRALQQLLSGVYLSTICLIGLFAIGTSGSRSAIGPLVLEVIFLIIVIFYQIFLDTALELLEQYLPLDLLANNDASLTVASTVEEQTFNHETEELFNMEKGVQSIAIHQNGVPPIHDKDGHFNHMRVFDVDYAKDEEVNVQKAANLERKTNDNFSNGGGNKFNQGGTKRFNSENRANWNNDTNSNLNAERGNKFSHGNETPQEPEIQHESFHHVPDQQTRDISHTSDQQPVLSQVSDYDRNSLAEQSNQHLPMFGPVSNPREEGDVRVSDEEKTGYDHVSTDRSPFEQAIKSEPQQNAETESHEEKKKQKPNFLNRWAKTHIYKSYEANKALLSGSDEARMVPHYTKNDLDAAYQSPDVASAPPLIWLAKDRGEVSKVMIEENKTGRIETTDDQAWFNEKSQLVWNQEHPEDAPIYKRFVQY